MMESLLAALPVLTILVLMAGLGWPAARAGAAGLAVTLLLAVGVLGYGRVIHGDLGVARALAGPLGEAAFTTATILWIIWPALAIYHLQSLTGSFDVLQRSIGRLARDRRIVALLVAWFLALFLEGAAGFGTPVALAAPFLVGVGFRPAEAVVLALVGHAAGVSFGAIGTPIVPQVTATGLPPAAIAGATALPHAVLGWLLPLVLLTFATGPGGAGSRTGRAWPWALAAAGLFLGPQLAIATWIGPELPTLGGALAGGLAFAFLWWRLVQRHETAPAGNQGGYAGTIRAAAPYVIVMILILLTRLVGPMRDTLRGLVWEWSAYDRFGGAVQPLYHPGTALLAALLPAALIQGAGPSLLLQALGRAGRQILPVSVALFAMLGLSRLLVHAGMIDALADTMASVAGGAWPLLTPLVGVLGTFVTGSATSSNILFTDLQVAAARQLGMPIVQALGAQGFGAAAGNMIAPHNVIAGAAAVGAMGREGEILRRTLGPCLLYALLGGGVVWILVIGW